MRLENKYSAQRQGEKTYCASFDGKREVIAREGRGLDGCESGD
jgi:hypothetical protein